MIDEVVDDYVPYMKVEVKKILECLDDNIDFMLTQLEEYESVIDMVRSSGDKCLDRAIPEMLTQREELGVLFERIDNLEKLVGRVKQNVATVEAQMDRAENDLRSTDRTKKLKSVFKPLFFKITGQGTATSPGAYSPPELFSTEKFFRTREEDTASEKK